MTEDKGTTRLLVDGSLGLLATPVRRADVVASAVHRVCSLPI
jgi:hypothetical protein